MLNRILILIIPVLLALVSTACTSGNSDASSPLINTSAVIATPASVNLGSNLNSAAVTLSGVVADPPAITGTGTNTAWLSVAASNTDANGLGNYTISADRTGLTNGNYSGAVSFDLSDGDTVVVNVTMRVSFSISGTITAASNTAVDSDLNDPFAPFAANDSIDTAQTITTPAIINGFVSLFGSGFPGDRFRTSGDEFDFYRATLLAGQYVSLRVADFVPGTPEAVDVDVELYDNNGKYLATSQTITEFESIPVGTDGDYYIKVIAYSGSSKYILNIGSDSLAPTANVTSISANFVPDQVIVKYRPQAAAIASTLSSTPGLHASHHDLTRPMLLKRDPGFSTQSIVSALGVTSPAVSPARQAFEAGLDEDSRRKLETLRLIKQLDTNPDIEYAEPNFIRRPLRTPNDPFYSFQLHYPQIRLPQAWDITIGAAGVIVAVVDTGVVLAHEDIVGQTVTGYDFISDPTNALDGTGIDGDPNDPGDSQSPGRSSWHGTHVAGTIAAKGDNNLGVTGIAWGAKVMPLRVLGEFGGTDYDIDQALRYAAGLTNDSGTTPAQTADIVNLSLGGPGFSQTSQDLYTALHNQGIIVIAAAGNENSSTPSYPAAYDNVVSVSALDYLNQRAPYSNFGPTVDVAAPGGDASVDRDGNGYPDAILSTLIDDITGTRDDSYAFYQGTSMAAPHVAGVAALMKSVNPGLTASDFDALLANGDLTVDAGANGRDDIYGFGVIDALKAVQAANFGIIPGTILATPTFIDLGTNQTSATLTLSEAGTTPPSVTTFGDDATWLTVTAAIVDANGIGTYNITIDRTGLADTSYRGRINFDLDNGSSVAVDIVMQVRSAGDQIGDTGFLYVLQVDPLSFDTVGQTELGATAGVYDYRFDDVAVGSYYIVAGSDIDNDGFICDIGESCGSYPVLNEQFALNVSGNRDNIDFISTVISGVTNRAGASTGHPLTGYRLLPKRNRENKAVGQ